MGLNAKKEPSFNVIPFQNEFAHISPVDLDNIMESLSGMGYLSGTGEEFRNKFWEVFIKG